jgi:hypothetical protein
MHVAVLRVEGGSPIAFPIDRRKSEVNPRPSHLTEQRYTSLRARLGIFVGSYLYSVIHAAFEDVSGMVLATAGLTGRAAVLLCRWFRYNPWNDPS